MSDWRECRVVRDERERMLLRTDGGRWLWQDYDDDGHASFPTVQVATFGPLTPVLDADGLPVVRTVGDLTARHIGKRVRVTPAGFQITGELTGVFATPARPVSLHVEDPCRALWIVGPEMGATLDTPCELLPEGDA